MRTYFFNLKTMNGDICDLDGMELADDEGAWQHARDVAQELMKRREPQTRSWRLDVRDSEGRKCFELLFATVDDAVIALGPELRALIENLHRKQASLIDAIAAVRLSLLQIQGVIAQSKGKPYLASVDGLTTIAGESAPQHRRSRAPTAEADGAGTDQSSSGARRVSRNRPRSELVIAASRED